MYLLGTLNDPMAVVRGEAHDRAVPSCHCRPRRSSNTPSRNWRIPVRSSNGKHCGLSGAWEPPPKTRFPICKSCWRAKYRRCALKQPWRWCASTRRISSLPSNY